MPNPYAKQRSVANPYAIYHSGFANGKTAILKLWKSPENTAKDRYARAFCAVQSDMTFGSWELGDVYVKDIPRDIIEGIDILKEVDSFGTPAKPKRTWMDSFYDHEAED